MRTCFSSLALVLIASLVPTVAYAQNAQISGSLKDQTGAVLPGVTVTAKNTDTGLARAGISQGNGDYRIPALPPGRYTVTTELQGFASETRPDIVLIIDQDAVLNFVLRPAQLSEVLTVTGEAPIVDTTKSDVSTSVSTE